MNRRTALFLTMLLGGWLPRRALAQTAGRKSTAEARTAPSAASPKKARPPATDPEVEKASNDEQDDTPANFMGESGQQWRTFDISRYTGLDHSQNAPQNALVEWIFRRTGTGPWHGDKVAVLSASRTQIRAYNNSKILDQTSEVIERFTNAVSDVLTIRVRYIAAVDTRWRYAVFSRLAPVGSGPQGQQIWTLKAEDLAFVVSQIQVYQGMRLLTDQKVEMVNGQTLTVETSEPRSYNGSMARESAVGLGYQPKAEQLKEGITLRLSPLLTFDGDALDAAIDLTANTVRGFHRTKVIAPREIGPSEITIDVPEVSETRLNQTVKGWPVGQSLVISTGIHPGHLQSKSGFLGMKIPGTVPTGTELIVVLDAEVASKPTRAAARDVDDEPAPRARRSSTRDPEPEEPEADPDPAPPRRRSTPR
ncbi:MAG: hypothetical protein U0794_02905 [Isosphaeraceae bacterium]